ncbi:hypothetical protein Aph02nite_09050 [Actinoplanes philippinensis]|uniref:Uncharacterized protein n=1 Tax=Actinoplanes philippinensis TaxID=35752 RepID=A0A1I2AF67_9ACTN|nr:hypothetical protein Aph02nite_09050 [Actinoplanes philippinensis]SFE41633.1 hypothetical protein SAMN05421541_101636 [Actinoplanes philippinensis]
MGSYAELGDAVTPAEEDRHGDLTPGEIRLRRLLAAAGAVAVVVGLLVFVPRLLRDEPPAPWNPPDWSAPVFPFEPSYLPGDPAEPNVFRSGPELTVQYVYGGGSKTLSAEVSTQSLRWGAPLTEEHPGDVGGRAATIRTAPNFAGVVWQLADGRRMMAHGWGGWTEEEVLRFARGLVPGSVPSSSPFTFAEVPPGLTLQQQSPWNMCLAPPEVAARTVPPTGLCVELPRSAARIKQLPDAETVTVAGRTARYQKDRTGGELQIDLDGGRTLLIQWDESIRLKRDDVIRFAAATTPAG